MYACMPPTTPLPLPHPTHPHPHPISEGTFNLDTAMNAIPSLTQNFYVSQCNDIDRNKFTL